MSEVINNIFGLIQTRVTADPILAAQVKTFHWSRKPKIFRQSDFPAILGYIAADDHEEFHHMPREKHTDIELTIQARVWAETYPVLRQTLTYLDEQIKRAMEADVQFSETVLTTKIIDTGFRQMSNMVGAIETKWTIRTQGFSAGKRSGN